jgi:pimeloyl-ACP methyl ester carboxylesterase
MSTRESGSPLGPLRHVFRNGWWWFLDYIYAVVWQVRAAISRTNPVTFQSGSLAPVVVIPGVYETWHFLRPVITALHNAGHPVHVVTALQHNRRPVADAAHLVADYIERANLTDAVIVAHSKGGLIGKYIMNLLDDKARIRGMVAISTPFGGSRYARYMVVPSLRAFAAADPGIVSLGADVRNNARIVSIFGVFDPHIPEGSALVGARNIRIDTGGHFRILGEPATIRTVQIAVTDATR